MKELDSKQRAFVLYAAKVLKCENGDKLNKKIQALSTDELNQLTTAFDKIYNQQMENSTLMAKLGTKLNYIKKLNGKCPEGYEVEVFKAGGKTCMRCKKAAQGALPVAAHKNGKAINDIKSEIAKGKKKMCGGAKMQNGGKAYDESEHKKLISDYKSGKIKQNSPQHKRLQELNRNSGHHNDGYLDKKAPTNDQAKKVAEQIKKHLQGGIIIAKDGVKTVIKKRVRLDQ